MRIRSSILCGCRKLPLLLVPLSRTLSSDHGLSTTDASVRFVSSPRYVWSRLALHAPFVIPAIVGMALILMRSASRDRLGLTIAGIVIIAPFLLAYLIYEVRQTTTSRGSQLCIVSLPTDAIRLLGTRGLHVRQDVGGRIPRYPLVATGRGIVLGPPHRHGGAVERVLLRDVGVRVELESTRRGRLAACILSRQDQRTRLAVRGRLRLGDA